MVCLSRRRTRYYPGANVFHDAGSVVTQALMSFAPPDALSPQALMSFTTLEASSPISGKNTDIPYFFQKRGDPEIFCVKIFGKVRF